MSGGAAVNADGQLIGIPVEIPQVGTGGVVQVIPIERATVMLEAVIPAITTPTLTPAPATTTPEPMSTAIPPTNTPIPPTNTPVPPTPRPMALSATVSNVQVEQHMLLGDYLKNDRELIEQSGLSEQHLSWRGVVIAFHVEISGFLDRECTVKYSVFDHDDGGLVPEGQWLVDDVAGIGDVVFIPEAPTDEANGEVWVPYPDAGGNYLTGPFNVRLAIHDDKDVAVSEYVWSGPISPVF